MNIFVRRGSLLFILFLIIILVLPVTAYTTEVTMRRYAVDGLTPITETTTTYQWMEANLPVYGDGDTYYYFQGPIFEGEWEANYGVQFPEYRTDWEGTPPDWLDSDEIWDRFWDGSAYLQNEETNWPSKNLGKLKGTDVKDLCDLVGGLPSGQKVRVIAADNVYQDVPYSVIYEPTDQLGPYVITWWSVDAGESGSTSGYTGPDYTNGMRATFFSDDSRNPSGEHVAGLGDQAEGIPQEYWYYYGGQYPSMGGWNLKYVDRIFVFSNDPVPPPVADFSANTKTGNIINGNFETGVLSPWTGSGVTVSSTFTQKKDSYSARLIAPGTGSAWIQQDLDFTDIGTISFWRHYYGGTGKYMEVLVGDLVVANFTETITVANKYETIDTTSFGFSGTHTLKFRAVNTNPSGSLTVYLDNIEDYGPGTSGNAPLTVQFKDLSTKMEDPAHTSWAWDFQNDGSVESTEQNPLFTYTADGTYTVKLTAANAGGSDSETKTAYISVGTATPPPDAEFSANVTSGTEPLAVQFTDESTNTPTSWRWAYKNDTVGWTEFATSQNPEYVFAEGTYVINLTATNTAGSDDEIKTGYIVVTGTGPTIDVDATGTITGWNLQPDSDNVDSSSIGLSVTTTATNWDVKVSDSSANPNKGHMSQWVDGSGWVSGGDYLATEMQVKAQEADSYVGANSNRIILDQSDGTGSYGIWLKQTTVLGDAVLDTGVYRVEITFTGSVN